MNIKVLILFLMVVCPLRAAVINVPCDFLSISNALKVTAQEGDEVIIGPGSCTMSNSLLLSRNVSFTIRGSGTNLTSLRSSANNPMIWIYGSSTNKVTVSDMDIVSHPSGSAGTLYFGLGTTKFNGYIHCYNLQFTNVYTRGISVGSGDSRGLVEYCLFSAPISNGPQMWDVQGRYDASWTNSIPFGTTNAVYFENNVCRITGTTPVAGNGFFDGYSGGQAVIRHNVFDGYSAAGWHGYDSFVSGMRSYEIYNNIFTNGIGSSTMSLRGGTGYVYSNLFYGTISVPIALSYYRSCPEIHLLSVTQTDYLLQGVTGKRYVFNFSGASSSDFPLGTSWIMPNGTNGAGGLPAHNSSIVVGVATTYYFVTNLNQATFHSFAYGGGSVLIGENVEQTISNLFYAINTISGGYGLSNRYYNASSPGGSPIAFGLGHDFLAVSMDATNLYLTNVLDVNSDIYGWPAAQQPGVITSLPLKGTNFNYAEGRWFTNVQQTWPCYAWSNYYNGSPVGFDLSLAVLSSNGCEEWSTNILKENRDFFNYQVPTNYTTLVFPHPLSISSGGPPPPDNGPTITSIASQSLPFFNSGTGVIPFMITDAEDDPDTLTVVASSDNTTLIPLVNVVLAGTGTNRNVTVNPVTGQWGTSIITLTVTDSATNTAISSFAVSVTQPRIINAGIGNVGNVVKVE